nr:DUF5058 family protein [Maliibacterium massiliense]
MPELSSVINSPFLFVLAGIVCVFVIAQSLFFGVRAYRKGLAMGMEKKSMKRVIRSAAIFSIVPSIPILIGLLTMVKALGLPLPWVRLSIVGSVSYELIAADLAAKGMGAPLGIADASFNAQGFAGAAWIMTIGIIWGLLCCIFLMPKVQGGVKKIQQKDNAWGTILFASLFMGMVCAFLGQGLASGWVGIITMVVAALLMFLLERLSKVKKFEWVGSFALSISMVCAMALSIPLTTWLG